LSKRFNHVWDAISDSPEEAENMKMRSVFMMAIEQFLEPQEGTQTDKAERLGLTQPRLNDLLKGRIEKFSLDSLVNIAAKAGLIINVDVKAA
jgi:predicted XRE-type DNA-binding protein